MFIKFSVKDTGIGLAPEDMSRLFQAFSQARDSVSREYGGSGLGLSICRQIIGQMGGDILARSDGRGTGSTFTFFIPYDPTTISAVDLEKGTKPANPKMLSPAQPSSPQQQPPTRHPAQTLLRKRSHGRRLSGSREGHHHQSLSECDIDVATLAAQASPAPKQQQQQQQQQQTLEVRLYKFI
jgi:hypothetical protein